MTRGPSRRVTRPPMEIRELHIASLAAGGDGVARDEGRVTFVPRTVPGDRIRARLVQATKSFARAELVELVVPSDKRVEPPCPHFTRGCGGCQWQHVARAEQLAAKQAIVTSALRKLAGLVVHPIEDPAPPLGWRRRARFHVAGGRIGLYSENTHDVLAIDRCPQLEPALDSALAAAAAASPPDGELALVRGHTGAIALATQKPWRGAERLVGTAGIVGVIAGPATHGDPIVEIERGLWGGPWDFAQASATGNAALIERMCEALGAGPGHVLELYAGAGNLTRALVGAGWDVLATDGIAPQRPITIDDIAIDHRTGPVADVLAMVREEGHVFDAVVLDPPRAGAAEAIDSIIRTAPRTIVYIACDPATLARDAERLVAAGYRATDAWPIDLMPQTSHVEVVLRLVVRAGG